MTSSCAQYSIVSILQGAAYDGCKDVAVNAEPYVGEVDAVDGAFVVVAEQVIGFDEDEVVVTFIFEYLIIAAEGVVLFGEVLLEVAVVSGIWVYESGNHDDGSARVSLGDDFDKVVGEGIAHAEGAVGHGVDDVGLDSVHSGHCACERRIELGVAGESEVDDLLAEAAADDVG